MACVENISPERIKRPLQILAIAVVSFLTARAQTVDIAEELQQHDAAKELRATDSTEAGVAGGPKGMTMSPAQTGETRPLYRLGKSDVLQVNFTFSPEFDQTLIVQPDGFITLKGVGDMYVNGMFLNDLRTAVGRAYVQTLRDPEVSIVLKDFDKPYFIATGELVRPGKFELRSDITVTQGVAVAGGFTDQSKHSRVVLFRRLSTDVVETKVLDVKAMLNSGNLSGDIHLLPGDLIFVPKNTMSKLRRYLPTSSLGTYLNPATF